MRRWIPVVLALAAHSVSAQESRRLAQPDSIPLDLATALITSGGFVAEPQILVGMLPGWMNARVFLPANGRVLGSAFSGSVTVGVLAVADQPETAIEQFKTELAKRGWKVPPTPPAQSYGGGFFPAPSPQRSAATPTTRLTLCGNEQILTVAATRRGAASQIMYRVTPDHSSSACNPQQRVGSSFQVPYPALFNPPQVADYRNFGTCSSEGQSWGTRANIQSPWSLDSLLVHYGRQMQDSGWHPTSAMATGRTWTKTDSAGAMFEATIIASTSPRDSLCRDLSLTVWSVRKP